MTKKGAAEMFDQFSYQNEYNRQKYDRIMIVLPKGQGELVRKRAEILHSSVNGYLRMLINKDLEKNESVCEKKEG